MQSIGIVPTAIEFAMVLLVVAIVATLNAHIRKALPLAQVRIE
jgi:hypothetical protein